MGSILKTAGRLLLALVAFIAAVFLWQMAGYVLAAALFIYLLQVKLDKASMRDLGLTVPAGTALREGGIGWLAGGVGVAAVILSQWGLGAIRPDTFLWADPSVVAPAWAVVASGLFAFAAVGFAEEAFFRGYLLQVVWRRHGLPAAVVVSSALFSLAHFANPGYNFLAFANVILVALLFTAIVLYYRNLWYAIGFHWAWDFVQSSLLHLPSTNSHFLSLLQFKSVPDASTVVTGGTYWPEGSILVTVLQVALILYFAWGLRRKARRGEFNASNPNLSA